MEEIYKVINTIPDGETKSLIKYMFKEFFHTDNISKMHYIHGSIVGACTVAVNFNQLKKEDLFYLDEYLNDLMQVRLKNRKHK